MEKEWMKAPLPPLSQSIIESGLVVGDYTVSDAKVQAVIATTTTTTDKKKASSRATSSHLSLSMMQKGTSSPKMMTQRSPKKRTPSIDSHDMFLFARTSRSPAVQSNSPSLSSRVTAATSTTTFLNTLEGSTTKNKPPPIEEFQIYSQKEPINALLSSHASSSAFLKSAATPIALDTNRKNLREEVSQITHELDANIAAIVPTTPDALSIEKQTEVKTKLLQSYNFSFNKLILQERTICTEKALLLRRFHKFYNQLIVDVPILMNNIHKYISEHDSKYETLLTHSTEVEKDLTTNQQENKSLKDQLDSIKRQLQTITESSNQKDIQLNSTNFDIDFAKGQITQFQYKLQVKSDRVKTLKRTVEQMTEENKNQLMQIENLTKTVNEFQQGETGYIVMYHKELAKNDTLIQKLKTLEAENFFLSNVEKSDAEVQTDPIGKAQTSGTTRKRRCTIKENSSHMKSTEQFNLKEDASKPPLLNSKLSKLQPLCNSDQMVAIQIPMKVAEKPMKIDVEVQTEEKSTINPNDNEIPQQQQQQQHQQQQQPNQEKTNSSVNKKPTKDLSSSFLTSQGTAFANDGHEMNSIELPTSIVTSDSDLNAVKAKPPKIIYNDPPDYNVDHKRLDEIPDLFEIIMPFLSQPYVQTTEQELKIINSKSFSMIVKSEKPTVWAIQIIHNFFTDPFIRSIENQNRTSTESIFVDWISRKYKLQHLINQAMSDFSSVLLNNRAISSFLAFFTELLMGKYSFSQLCFLSTIYTFSHDFTFPNLAISLQDLSSEDLDPKIHIECIEKILVKCFTEDLTERFLRNLNVTRENPMVRFLEFLEKVADFFGEKHHLLYTQSKDLLILCGCYDNHMINYDVFVKFFSLLKNNNGNNNNKNYYGNSFNFKEEWKKALSLYEEKNASLLKLAGILTICAEKKTPLMEIIEMTQLSTPVMRIKSLQSFVSDLYFDILSRFSTVIPHIFSKLPATIAKKLTKPFEDVRQAILRADLGQIIFLYRRVLMKIDSLVMKERGFIPFNPQSNSDTISKLVEYIDRTESVAFAMIT